MFFLLVPIFAAGPWIGAFRRPGKVFCPTNLELPPPYQISFNLIHNASMQSDFDDIRFNDTDDNPLDYYRPRKTDGNNADFVVESFCNTSNGTQFFVYYGNAGLSTASDFNTTFSNLWVPNGDFEDETPGNAPDDWTVTGDPGFGVVEVRNTEFIVGVQSVFYRDSSGGGQPNLRRSFDAHSNKTILEFSMFVESSPVGTPFLRIGATTGDFNVQSVIWNTNNTISVFPGNSERALNVTYTDDIWHNVSISFDFGTDKNKIWIDDQFTGEFDFRENSGEADNMDDFSFQAGTPTTVDYFVDGIRLRRFVEPEPAVAIGAEQAAVINTTVTVTFDPASPHIEERVDFNATASADLNITVWWWDFDDGTAIFATTENTTNHTFALGGDYNVTLVGLNESNVNITGSAIVSIFEPTIVILAQNVATGGLVSNFTVTAANSTSAFNFTAVGTAATWNYTDGPFGLVNLSVIAFGFNHTVEQINITNSSDVNFTTSLFPAVVQIWTVTNYEFTNVRGLPADIEISNGTSQLTFGPVEEFTFNDTYQGSGVAGNSEIGSIWRWLYNVISPGSLVTNIDLCDEDGDNCIRVRNLTNTDNEEYLMLEPDGTYKIRTPGGTLVSSGTFAFFPGTLEVEITGDPSDVANFKFFEMKLPYVGCTINNGCPIGNVTARITQTTAGIYGFIGTTYQPLWLSFTDVAATDVRNKTAYMINNANAFGVKFVVIDDARSFVSNAEVIVFRSINGTLQELTSALTDLSGEVPTSFLQKNTQVIVIASRGGRTTGLVTKFITENRIINPIFLSLQLLAFEVLPVAFNSTSIIVTPAEGTTLRGNTTVQFNVSIFNSEGTLTNSTVWLNSTGLNFSFFQSSSSGSGLLFLQNVSIPIVNATSNRINLFYSVTDENSGTFSRTITYVVFPDTGLAILEDDVVPFLGPFQHLVSLLVLAGAYSISITLGAFISLGLFIAGMTTLEVALLSATTVFFLRQQEVKR